MFCLLEVRQIQSGHLPLGQGFLNALRKPHYNSVKTCGGSKNTSFYNIIHACLTRAG